MPKSRYQVMRQTLPARGKLALDMMLMTSTGQVSLDWSRRGGLRAQGDGDRAPVAAAGGAVRQQPAGPGQAQRVDAAFRSHVWSDVDPTRVRVLPRMLDGTFDYGAYVEWALMRRCSSCVAMATT